MQPLHNNNIQQQRSSQQATVSDDPQAACKMNAPTTNFLFPGMLVMSQDPAKSKRPMWPVGLPVDPVQLSSYFSGVIHPSTVVTDSKNSASDRIQENKIQDAIRFYQTTLERLRSDVLSLIDSPCRLISRFLREWTDIQSEDNRRLETIPRSICVEIQERITAREQVIEAKRQRLHELHVQDAKQLHHFFQVPEKTMLLVFVDGCSACC